jgi:hypothetical protein
MAIVGQTYPACAHGVFQHPVGGAGPGGSVMKRSWKAESSRLINSNHRQPGLQEAVDKADRIGKE